MRKKQLVLYGNCQIHVISDILSLHSEFTDEYEITWDRPVQTPQDDNVTDLHTRMKNADVFIHQSVSASYRGVDFSSDYLKTITDARCIWLFNYWFCGYNPEIGEVKIRRKKKPIDLMIFRHYYSGVSVEDTYDHLKNDNDPVAEQFARKIAKNGIAGLKRRQTIEKNKGGEIIGAVDLIDKWTEHWLGISKMHPTYAYYETICNRILDALGISRLHEGWWKPKWSSPDELVFGIHSLVRWPVQSYVRRMCPGVNFEPKIGFSFGESEWGLFDQFDLDYIEHWYSTYEEQTDVYLEFYRKHTINGFFPI
jgi:hypothetical protein